MVLGMAAAFWGVGGGVLAPGWALCRSLSLGREGGAALELALALAIGRLLLAATTAVAIAFQCPSALLAWPVAGSAAAAFVAFRGRSAAARWRLRGWESGALPWLVGVAAAALLVHAVIGRNGLEDSAGRLLFFGRDATNDSLMYLAQTRMLLEDGFPLANPFFGGVLISNSYVPFLVRAGLYAAAGVPWLDLTFRVLPLLDVCGLALTSGALVRALGGSRLAVGLGAVLTVLGSEASFLLPILAKLCGGTELRLATWGMGGPGLLAFNSITPAVQTLIAALLLWLAPNARPRAAAVVAGVLFGALFELKIFLWLSAMLALVGVALLVPPAPLRSRLRLAAAAAILVSLPSIVEKAVFGWQMQLQGVFDTGIRLCPGCLPRYLVDGVVGRDAAPWSLFTEFRNSDLLQPGKLAYTLFASVLFGLIFLGARWIAIPELVRRAWNRPTLLSDAGPVAVARITLASATFGLALSMLFAWRPHYLDVGQFAWSATFLLWPFTALVIGRWWSMQHGIGVLLLLASLLSTRGVLDERGYGAKLWLAVEPGERELIEELRSLSQPGDVVMEPSFGLRPEVPSNVPWLAGRATVFTDLSIASHIKAEARDQRLAQLGAVFNGQDPGAAAAALRASGAQWVYVPAPLSLRFPTQGLLLLASEGRAGRIYRVLSDGSPAPTEGRRDEPGRPESE